MKYLTTCLFTLFISTSLFATDKCRKGLDRFAEGEGSPQALTPTPPQTDGPFYPGRPLFHRAGNDLTQRLTAKGQPIIILGKVVNLRGEPLNDVEVHIWQTDGYEGRYKHDRDTTGKPIDPFFFYWGRDISSNAGAFRFRSVRPIEYQASGDWWRPDHIHLMVYRSGAAEPTLTTQIYFARENNGLLLNDLIYQSLTPSQRKAVTVEYNEQSFTWDQSEGPRDILVGELTLVVDL